jgi:hypothetical protein
MPYARTIHHSRFANHFPRFFPSRITIERPEFTQNVHGEELPTAFITIYSNIPAAISPVIRLGEEWRNWRLEFVLEQITHRSMLQGLFRDIKATDRMIDQETGEIYNIVSRHLDSHRRMTRLDTRQVHPQAIEGIS